MMTLWHMDTFWSSYHQETVIWLLKSFGSFGKSSICDHRRPNHTMTVWWSDPEPKFLQKSQWTYRRALFKSSPLSYTHSPHKHVDSNMCYGNIVSVLLHHKHVDSNMCFGIIASVLLHHKHIDSNMCYGNVVSVLLHRTSNWNVLSRRISISVVLLLGWSSNFNLVIWFQLDQLCSPTVLLVLPQMTYNTL